MPFANPTLEAGPRSILRPPDEAVLYGIVVDVIEVRFEVAFVADRMFPKSALPNAASPFAEPRGRTLRLSPAALQPRPSELPLDPSPPQRIGVIARWQGPKGMQMLGQQHDSRDFKRVAQPTFPHRLAQQAPRRLIRKQSRPAFGNDREKVGSPRNEVATIIRHADILHPVPRQVNLYERIRRQANQVPDNFGRK